MGTEYTLKKLSEVYLASPKVHYVITRESTYRYCGPNPYSGGIWVNTVGEAAKFSTVLDAAKRLIEVSRDNSRCSIVRVETTPGKSERRIVGPGTPWIAAADDKFAIQYTGYVSPKLGRQHAQVCNDCTMLWRSINDATLFDTEGDALLAVSRNSIYENQVDRDSRIVRVAVVNGPDTVKETVLG